MKRRCSLCGNIEDAQTYFCSKCGGITIDFEEEAPKAPEPPRNAGPAPTPTPSYLDGQMPFVPYGGVPQPDTVDSKPKKTPKPKKVKTPSDKPKTNINIKWDIVLDVVLVLIACVVVFTSDLVDADFWRDLKKPQTITSVSQSSANTQAATSTSTSTSASTSSSGSQSSGSTTYIPLYYLQYKRSDGSHDDTEGGSGPNKYEIIIADVTWEEAYDLAIEKGGYLARINNKSELNYIPSVIKQYAEDNSLSYDGYMTSCAFWVGGARYYDDYYYDEWGNYSPCYYWCYGDDRRMFPNDGAPFVGSDDRTSWYKVKSKGISEPDLGGKYRYEDKIILDYRKGDCWTFADVENDVIHAGYSDDCYQSGHVGYIIEYDN